MASLLTGRVSAARAGWLVALLFFGWLAFLLLPTPRPGPQPPPAFVPPPPSRLVALGLPDNPDLDALPEIFAMYADKAEWKNDRTIFAYWNPGSQSYAYFFEATRAKGAYRFKAIPEQTVREEDEAVESGLYFLGKTSADCPVRLIYSYPQLPKSGPNVLISLNASSGSPSVSENPSLATPIKMPPFELKLPPLDLEPKNRSVPKTSP